LVGNIFRGVKRRVDTIP